MYQEPVVNIERHTYLRPRNTLTCLLTQLQKQRESDRPINCRDPDPLDVMCAKRNLVLYCWWQIFHQQEMQALMEAQKHRNPPTVTHTHDELIYQKPTIQRTICVTQLQNFHTRLVLKKDHHGLSIVRSGLVKFLWSREAKSNRPSEETHVGIQVGRGENEKKQICSYFQHWDTIIIWAMCEKENKSNCHFKTDFVQRPSG